MKKHLTIISLLPLTAIALSGCELLRIPASSSDGKESTTTSTHVEPYPIPDDSSSSAEPGTVGLTFTLGNEYVSEGTSFLDSADPYVSFFDGTTSKAVSNTVVYSIHNQTNGKNYSEEEALEPGLYSVTASYTYGKDVYTAQCFLSVRPYEAERNKGYSQVDLEYTISTDPELGVFGMESSSPTLGSPKFLVVPVTFNNVPDFTQTELDNIYDAYLADGMADKGGFYSLHEYYYRSSYGKLDLDIEIADPLELPISTSTFEKDNNYLWTLMSDFLNEFVDNRGINLSDYDSDGNGYMDGIHFIYKTDKSVDGTSDIWWNYTTGFEFEPNEIHPSDDPEAAMASPAIFFFSAYVSMMSTYASVPDSHTIIHESGHMLGLNDYYSYDYDEAPAGGSMMMDLNVGDHDPYSKMLMGWVDPYVVDGTSDHFEITLRPFERSGDVVLLRNTSEDPFNGTPFDEYLTLSYYTPTGLNEPDSRGYPEWSVIGEGRIYDQPGLQVYHVDSRTGIETRNFVQTSFEYVDVDEATAEQKENLRIGADNTQSRSCNENFRLIEAVASDGLDHFTTAYYMEDYLSYFGNNEILFGNGSAYGGSQYTNAKFTRYYYNGNLMNDGTAIEYSFRVMDMDGEGLTLRFDRIGQ